ncbi:MAG: hypothetical protein RR675_05200 [Oscillospiraceae bacterium]
MKRIINGKTYNTETAKLVCEHSTRDENGNWRATINLYKTKNGAFFLGTVGNGRDIWAPDDGIEILTEADAKIFCEEHGSADEYIAEWGEPAEA